mgnify:CR=1 FL=1
MTGKQKVVLILGSGPNVTISQNWPSEWFDHIVVMNNAWRVRPDWNALVYPEDFPAERMPDSVSADQRLTGASAAAPGNQDFARLVLLGAPLALDLSP